MKALAVVEEGKNPPILELGDVRLRPLRTGDEIALAGYLSDPRVTEHTSIPAVTLESVRAAVQRDIAAYAEGTSCRFALAQSDDQLIGICGFNSWSPTHRHAELAYELAPQYWRRGYMRRAVNAVLQRGFATVRLNRVHAFVMTSNLPSIGLLERCGFIREGVLRQFRIARGTPRDFYAYAQLAQDFPSTIGGASSNPSLQRTPPG
jgi:ribosomal-protein-alanine N-acetyltransferase